MDESKVVGYDQQGNIVEIIDGICECGKKLDIRNKGAISTHCNAFEDNDDNTNNAKRRKLHNNNQQ